MPDKWALNAVVHGRVVREGYTVDRVYFESLPGHYVTGSLYRPTTRNQSMPGVLSPHGHWPEGRFYDHGENKLKAELSSGGERFDPSGRYPLQARCVQLARMGCVVFHYDMEGYADSIQFQHRAGVRDAMNTPEHWGYFSPQAELRNQSMMGLQTWNSIRALDFLLSLPEVDADRIGVTGASGGGTQTLLLGAIDDRVSASFPAVMPSTAMQGGCTCENASLLRIGAGNIDLAACMAPRPLGMSGADDWTIELESKGLPELKALYAMLGKPDHVFGRVLPQYKHNYNAPSRSMMYDWFKKHLRLPQGTSTEEKPFTPLTRDELTVWSGGKHSAPSGDQVGEVHERALLDHLNQRDVQQVNQLLANRERFQEVVGGAWSTLIDRHASSIGPVHYEQTFKEARDGYILMAGTLGVQNHGEELPALFLHPQQGWNGEVVLWLTDTGKDGLLKKDQPLSEISRLLEKGYSIMGLDFIGTGEFSKEGKSWIAQPYQAYRGGSAPWQKAACYTYGYNHSLFIQRVHDIMSGLSFVLNDEHRASKVHAVATGRVAGTALVAAATEMKGPRLGKLLADTKRFRFDQVIEFQDVMFVPGAVKFLDVDALFALAGERVQAIRSISDGVERLSPSSR